jgi:hypothetical protein
MLPSNGDCDIDNYPDFHGWGFYGGVASTTVLTWQQVRDELLTQGKPFAFSRVDKVHSPDVEHMVVVIGVDDEVEQGLVILDPRGFRIPASQGHITYSDYAGNAQFENRMNFYWVRAP